MPNCGGNFNDFIGTFLTLANIIFSCPGSTSKICALPFPLNGFFSVKLMLLNYLYYWTFTPNRSWRWTFSRFFRCFLKQYTRIHLAGTAVSMISTSHYCGSGFFCGFLHAPGTLFSKNLDVISVLLAINQHIQLSTHSQMISMGFCCVYDWHPV